MVSSDFGKLEVMRHLISGIDWAIAGEATAAAAAAPVAETFKKSRRFIVWPSPCGAFFNCFRQTASGRTGLLGAAFNTENGGRKRDIGTTHRLNESRSLQAAAIAPLSCSRTSFAMAR